MLQRFRAKKDGILDKLRVPDGEYTDLSPKGNLDAGIRDLVAVINHAPGCVTTSSCAGRVAVYLDGVPKTSTHSTTTSASGGKGGGKWFYTSHDPIAIDEAGTRQGALLEKLGLPCATPFAFPPPGPPPPFVHFKFEPMILHILCDSGNAAQMVLTAATLSGFRESGISSLFDAKHRQTTPMVAVRSNGLALDCIVAWQNAAGDIIPMVSEAYLRTLILLANDRFMKNAARTQRFFEAFRERSYARDNPDGSSSRGPGYHNADLFTHPPALETEADRAARRRAQDRKFARQADEGKARRMSIRAGSGSESGHEIDEGDDE